MTDSTYDAADSAARHGVFNEWAVEYLNGDGGNAKLARKLSRHGGHHTQIIDHPLDGYGVILGPSPSFLFPEDAEPYEQRVVAMVESLGNGWKPAPLIVTDLWGDGLKLADGSHRHEALKRLGITTYPTVFYFGTAEGLAEFEAGL